MYSDDEAAALYDTLNGWGPDDAFYLALAMEAVSVLDVGCGTGRVLRRARETGHQGRLCGVDPDQASLRVAGRRTSLVASSAFEPNTEVGLKPDPQGIGSSREENDSITSERGSGFSLTSVRGIHLPYDIEWVAGTAASMTWDGEFDLAIMSGHAFQALVGDDELRSSLAAIRRALAGGGRFAFETRNPLARPWESWNPENAIDVVDPSGRSVRISHEVLSVVGDVVTLTETTSDSHGAPLRVDRADLRFLDVGAVSAFLARAGFKIEAQFGGWFGEPLDPASPEIVTIAR